MPLPIIHTFAGYSLYQLARRGENRWGLLALCIILSNLADFDIVPGLLIGNADRFHRGCAHSLTFALGFASLITVAYAIYRKVQYEALKWTLPDPIRPYARLYLSEEGPVRNRISTWAAVCRVFAVAFAAYSTHIILDMLTGSGVPLYWPFVQENFVYPVSLFNFYQPGPEIAMQMGGFDVFFGFMLSPLIMKPMLFEATLCFGLWAVWTALSDLRKNKSITESMALVRVAQACIFAIGFIVS